MKTLSTLAAGAVVLLTLAGPTLAASRSHAVASDVNTVKTYGDQDLNNPPYRSGFSSYGRSPSSYQDIRISPTALARTCRIRTVRTAIRTSTKSIGSKSENPGSDAGVFLFDGMFRITQILLQARVVPVCAFAQHRLNLS